MAQDFTVDRNSSKWVLGDSGVLVEYAADEPAIEFNADGSYKGVLVEPASTQLLGGDTHTPTTQTITVTAAEHTLSFYGTGSVVLSGAATGTLTGSGTSAERVSLTFTPSAGSLTLTVSGSPEYWQLEVSPIATSYIRNTGAVGTSVSRVADDIYLTSASSLIGQTEGTLYVEVDWQNDVVSQGILDINDGSVFNRVMIFNSGGSSANMYIRGGGGNTFNQGVSSTSFTGIKKLAFTYEKSATATLKLFIDGTLVSTGTNEDTSAVTGLDEVIIGGQPTESGVSEANMWIRAVALFTTRLSDAECEALTTI